MKRMVTQLAMVCLIVLAFAGPAMAGETGSVIRFGPQYVSPTGTYEEIDTDIDAKLEIEADTATGFFFAYEYQFTDRIGIEPSLSFQSHDVNAKLTDLTSGATTPKVKIADVDVMPLLVALNFHVLDPESMVDLYVAPIIGYVRFSDLNLIDEASESIDPAFAWGADVGVDVRFGQSKWYFTGALQYLKFAAEGGDDGETASVDIDPFVARVGVAIKF